VAASRAYRSRTGQREVANGPERDASRERKYRLEAGGYDFNRVVEHHHLNPFDLVKAITDKYGFSRE
jgi:hypothetical protein